MKIIHYKKLFLKNVCCQIPTCQIRNLRLNKEMTDSLIPKIISHHPSTHVPRKLSLPYGKSDSTVTGSSAHSLNSNISSFLQLTKHFKTRYYSVVYSQVPSMSLESGQQSATYLKQEHRSKNTSKHEFIQICKNNWFIIPAVHWTVSIIWGRYYTHNVSKVCSTPVSDDWLSFAILFKINDDGWDQTRDMSNTGPLRQHLDNQSTEDGSRSNLRSVVHSLINI
jgi:hypothetical protein